MSIVTCPKCGTKNRIDPERSQTLQPVCGRCGTLLSIPSPTSTEPLTLTDQIFASTLAAAGSRPLLVDCWAPWCGPCRQIAPAIQQLAAESAGQYLVAKLNVDENPRTASTFNISSIPTLLIFKNGQLVDHLVGLQPKPTIAARLSAHLT
ncbi:MAG: thioredoxin [Bacillota bacterium]